MKKSTGLVEKYLSKCFPGLSCQVKYLEENGCPRVEVWEGGEMWSYMTSMVKEDNYDGVSNAVIQMLEFEAKMNRC